MTLKTIARIAFLFVLSLVLAGLLSGVALAADPKTPAEPPTPDQLTRVDHIFWWSLGAAIIVVIGASALGVIRSKDKSLRKPMGPVDWSFSTSWASNLTVVGAVLTTVLGASVFPDAITAFPLKSAATIGLFFAILVVLAPIVYEATALPKPEHQGDGGVIYHRQGYVWGFVVASMFTVWGSLGQTFVVYRLFGDIRTAGWVSPFIAWGLRGAIGLGIIALVVYAFSGILSVVGSTPSTVMTRGMLSERGSWSVL